MAAARSGGAGLAVGTGALGQVHPDRCSVTLSLPAASNSPGATQGKGEGSGILGSGIMSFSLGDEF